MSLFALLVTVFVISRVLGFGYRRRIRRGRAFGWHPYAWGPVQLGCRARRVPLNTGTQPAPAVPERSFDTLKARYVRGELSDEQYERELDQMLKSPEGRSQIN